jgi:hypothetical protein
VIRAFRNYVENQRSPFDKEMHREILSSSNENSLSISLKKLVNEIAKRNQPDFWNKAEFSSLISTETLQELKRELLQYLKEINS